MILVPDAQRTLPITPVQGPAAMIAVEDLRKDYTLANGHKVRVLKGLELRLPQGSYTAIMGPSGSGKSTLLQILGCLDSPSAGSYLLAGQEVASLNETALARVRNLQIGFVFQSFNLLPRFNILHNVALPLVYAGVAKKERLARAKESLVQVGLEGRLEHLPAQLSGGQRQRVAIARAIVTRPSILLADEPTGNLDSRTGDSILALFDTLHRQGSTLVMVTHEPEVAARCQLIVTLRDGLIEDIRAANAGVWRDVH